jgi:predicted acetyltransferase
MSKLETRLTSDPADMEALAPIVAWAFGNDPRSSLEWLQRGEPGCLRVASRAGRNGVGVEAGLLEIPMGQWFGGERLSMLGLAGVAVAPEARGQGVAFELLQATLRAARERDVALSMLYPSTYRLYRKAGYELAGSYCNYTLQIGKLPRVPRTLSIVSLDGAAAEVLYRRVARGRDGHVDRGPYVWRRVREPRGEQTRGFGVSDAGGLIGYVYARPAELRKMPLELALSDFVTSDRRAFQALLGFFAEHSSLAERVSWHGGPADARLLGVPERALQVSIEEYWMLRLVHVERALLGRGYPELDADVDLVVEDALLPENSGRHALRVRAGKAQRDGAAPSGKTSAARCARLGVGALAAIYSGFVSPRELAAAGAIEADERTLGTLGALFAGPAPSSADFF